MDFSWIEWAFSGIGIAIVPFIYKYFKSKESTQNTVTTVSTIGINEKYIAKPALPELSREEKLEVAKAKTKILFIDDETSFKVANILIDAGWINTRLIKDCTNLDSPEISQTDIFFIDIQGVGIALGFKEQGLGLAIALKNKYKDKKLVIYSAENKGERFHEALKKADDSIDKNADPYEFQSIVEKLVLGEE
ncbi:hypothetical protein HA399_07530 [Cobetia sp. UIB-001]|uniref:hypothetical protein n=1 Tax=Cobetia sp. UIB-001 TaxID=2717697 RepID=UPI00384E136B